MTKAKTSPAEDKSRTLAVKDVPGKTRDRVLTDMVAQGVATNAATATRFVGTDLAGVSLTDMVASLQAQGEAVNRGDLSDAERMLNAQAVALNAIFSELARVAHANLFTRPDVTDRYLRLGLKAQSQSRATIETLAGIKNPPVVFARQANIAQQQVVSNGIGPPARAGETQVAPSELSGGTNELLEDTRASGAIGSALPAASPLGAVHRAADR